MKTANCKPTYFRSNDKEAGWRSAVLFSIIESCRSRGIDPHEYLRDVLARLPESTNWQVPDLVPERWQKAKQSDTNANRTRQASRLAS